MSDLFHRRVWLRTAWEDRRALLGWGIAFLLLTVLLTSYFPALRDQADEMQALLDSYPPAMKAFFGIDDLTSPAGYLWAQMFSVTLPLLLIVFAVGRGANLVAGAEERGELDVLLALPLTRTRVLAEKALGLAASVALMGVVIWVALLAGDALFGLDVGAARHAGAVLAVSLLALALGLLALAVGAWRGRRGVAIAAAAAVGGASYVLNSLAELASALEPLRPVLPWHHYVAANPLAGDASVASAVVLVGVALASLAFAVWAFERRDVGT